MADPVLEISNLNIRFSIPEGEVHAVRGASLTVHEGETLGIVGESGSGKSQLFLSVMGLLAANGRATGSIRYRGTELIDMPQARFNQLRGSRITTVFQDPLTALTPHMRVGEQIIEILRVHHRVPQLEAERRCMEILDLVRIPDAARRMQQYPHELSGGMRQRVMIAMATVCGPDLLIADEPTTALDLTVQAQILDILRDLQKELKTAIVLISHDIGVVSSIAHRMTVMRAGEIVEEAPTERLLNAPAHPYTVALLEAMPRLDNGPNRDDDTEIAKPVLLDVEDLRVHFPIRVGGRLFAKTRPLRAVDGVSFRLHDGETLGIVGESGCGKSTLARAVLRLLPPTAGQVTWMGRQLGALDARSLARARKDLQIVFQDPLASLDPRRTIGQSIAEPLMAQEPHLGRHEIRARVEAMMNRVGLDSASINRYPHEFSGGQNQRAGIARAMILQPKLIICDEAVSALDASIQAQIVDLIRNLQRQFGMAMLFISHDLAVVHQVAHRVMVMYMGRVVELADRDTIFLRPQHPYTRALIAALPDPDRGSPQADGPVPGELMSPLDSRASLVYLKSRLIDDPDAEQYRPKLIEAAPGHLVAEHDA